MHVDLTEGMLEKHLGMPGIRPAETRLLLLPDWHYQVPFARAALTDANVSIFLSVLMPSLAPTKLSLQELLMFVILK